MTQFVRCDELDNGKEGIVRRGEERVGRELGKGVDYYPSNLSMMGRPGDNPTTLENFKVDALDRFVCFGALSLTLPFLLLKVIT